MSAPRRVYALPEVPAARPGPPLARREPDGWLTVAEVSAAMRVSKMTAYRLIHAGDLAAVRVGRSFRVRQSAFHAYLQRQQTGCHSSPSLD